ncbi:receptor-transporting protein 3-like [Cololabis saira]|uniref:receptor-transporting protein 3-like n=1 Tax=Cololabis saira TaxID=129043 RepID=UPI002AD3DED0|nr:receptor-transporting protein 3-like [Cololabis saira]
MSSWDSSLWTRTFEELLDDDSVFDYQDAWTLNFNYNLTDEITQEERRRGWKVFSPCARGKFLCQACNKTWSSARVTVLFRYRLRRDRGTVIMRPFGQACLNCNEDFYLPGFNEKEVTFVLTRLFTKIRKNCYGEVVDDGDRGPSYTRRSKPHEASLCEACEQGICCQKEEQN